jgi:hypothetical protein
MAMNIGKYTTEEAMAALSLTVEEIEEIERNPTEESELPIGKFGSLFREYIEENYLARHAILLLEMQFYDVCREVDTEAREMMEALQNQLRAESPRPRGDFMATVQYETTIRDRAEEIVLREIVYRPR